MNENEHNDKPDKADKPDKPDTNEFGITELVYMQARLEAIQNLKKEVMKEGIDYGQIPNTTSKPSLLKPGGEKLCTLFMLAPRYFREVIDLSNEHREYRHSCELLYIPTGRFVGSGEGSCSTLESKYRYRWQDTKQAIPQEYWNLEDLSLLNGGYPRKAKGSKIWTIHFRRDNPDIADLYNTILKMSGKRAFLSAVLMVTGGSEIFTQDIEPDPPDPPPPKPTPPKPKKPPKDWKDGIPADVQKIFREKNLSQKEAKSLLAAHKGDFNSLRGYLQEMER